MPNPDFIVDPSNTSTKLSMPTMEFRWVQWSNSGGRGMTLEQAWVVGEYVDGRMVSEVKDWRPVPVVHLDGYSPKFQPKDTADAKS